MMMTYTVGWTIITKIYHFGLMEQEMIQFLYVQVWVYDGWAMTNQSKLVVKDFT